MKKCVSVILCVLLLCGIISISVSAHPSRLMDDADLLTPDEEAVLLAQLDEVSQTYNVDVVIRTTHYSGKVPFMDVCERYYDSNGYGFGASKDGVMLSINMTEREWVITRTGIGLDAISNSNLTDIGDRMSDDLSSEDYASAFKTFVDESTYYINGEINGYPFPFGMNLLISLAVGFVIALIVTGIMRAKLKSVRPQIAATEYLRSDSLQITQANEIFLYRNVTRVKKQTQNNNHSGVSFSSSGRSGGGKF